MPTIKNESQTRAVVVYVNSREKYVQIMRGESVDVSADDVARLKASPAVASYFASGELVVGGDAGAEPKSRSRTIKVNDEEKG